MPLFGQSVGRSVGQPSGICQAVSIGQRQWWEEVRNVARGAARCSAGRGRVMVATWSGSRVAIESGEMGLPAAENGAAAGASSGVN